MYNLWATYELRASPNWSSCFRHPFDFLSMSALTFGSSFFVTSSSRSLRQARSASMPQRLLGTKDFHAGLSERFFLLNESF